jgi:hypothetical protein
MSCAAYFFGGGMTLICRYLCRLFVIPYKPQTT